MEHPADPHPPANEGIDWSLAEIAKHLALIDGDLLDDDNLDVDFDDMDDATALSIIRRNYISGACGSFAVALHDKLGLPIIGLNGPLHIAVQAPDGDVIDFEGKNPLPRVLRRYGMAAGTPVTVLTRDEVVDDVLMGNEEGEDEQDEIAVAKYVVNKLGRW